MVRLEDGKRAAGEGRDKGERVLRDIQGVLRNRGRRYESVKIGMTAATLRLFCRS